LLLAKCERVSTDDSNAPDAGCSAARCHGGDKLAVAGLVVELPLARHHELCAAEKVIESGRVQDELRAFREFGGERCP
jgi:hypothetical protein